MQGGAAFGKMWTKTIFIFTVERLSDFQSWTATSMKESIEGEMAAVLQVRNVPSSNTPGCFVASLQPLWDKGKGTATNLELRPHRNLEPGQAQNSTTFRSTAQAQAEVESAFPSTSTHPNTGCPTLTLPISCDAWGPQRSEFWQTGAFCSTGEWCHTVSLGVPFYVTSAHLPAEVIQFITALSQSARLATEQLTDSKCPTTFHTALGKSCEKTNHSPLG